MSFSTDPSSSTLGPPPGIQGPNTGIPTTVDLSNGAGLQGNAGLPGDAGLGGPGGLYLDAAGKPFAQKNPDGSTSYLMQDGTWTTPTGGGPRQTATSSRPVSVPRSGIIYDPTTHSFVNAYTGQTMPTAGATGTTGVSPYGGFFNPAAMYAGFHPTISLNPGQSVANSQGQITGHAPLYDPAQYALLVDQAKKQYQLQLMEAERNWQQDRDVQAFRQATLQAQTDYGNQLLQIQHASLAAQSAIQDRQMAQPMIHDNPDGSVQTILPSAMVGSAFSGRYGFPGTDWSSLNNFSPMTAPQMAGLSPQQVPDVTMNVPDSAGHADPAFQPLPPAAPASSGWTIDTHDNSGASANGSTRGDVSLGAPVDTGSGVAQVDPNAGASANGSTRGDVSLGQAPAVGNPILGSTPTELNTTGNNPVLGPSPAPAAPQAPFAQAQGGGVDTTANNPIMNGTAAPPSPPSLPSPSTTGLTIPDIGGGLHGVWDALTHGNTHGQDAFNSQVQSGWDALNSGVSAPRAGHVTGEPDPSGSGKGWDPMTGQYDLDLGGGAGGGDYVGAGAGDEIPVSPRYFPRLPLPQDGGGYNPPFQPWVNWPEYEPMPPEEVDQPSNNYGSGAGDVDLHAIGAGPHLGQPLQTPPGGIASPIDPQQVVGLGHRFGEDTGDETPWHKGVDYQAFQGTPVHSPVNGIVTDTGDHDDLGLAVDVLDGSGQQHEMNHLSAIDVANGSHVQQGQTVGLVGSTGNSSGPHLDYRVRGADGDFSNPMTQPSISIVLAGRPDMSGAGHGGGDYDDYVGSGDDGSGDNPDNSDQSGNSSDWAPGSQYNQQNPDTGGWQQVTVGNDGSFSTSDIAPSDYSAAGIPTTNNSNSSWGPGSSFWENPSSSGGFSPTAPSPDQGASESNAQSPVAAAAAAGVVNAPTGGSPQSPHPAGGPQNGFGGNRYTFNYPGQPAGYVPHGFHVTTDGMYDYFTDDTGAFLGYNKHFDPAQIQAQTQQFLSEQGGTTMQLQLQQIQANEQMQQSALAAQYQQLQLQATSAQERLQLQLDYNRSRDQIQQQSLFKQLEVQQQEQAAQEASQERIAGTQARANVLGVWGRAAANSPWLGRMSGRIPTPGDVGSGVGFGTQSPSSQQLLTGQGQQPTTWQGMINPAGGTSWSGGSLGWGGGDYEVGSGDDGTGATGDQTMNMSTDTHSNSNSSDPFGASASSGFGNSINDLSGGGVNNYPTASQWEQLGPFGHTALQFTLQSAGQNWAPYAENMTNWWRNTGQVAPNGVSGWGMPDVTHLGFDAMQPIQHENWQQDAELFGPYSDYTTRLGRDWMGAAQNMTSVHG